MQTSFPNSSSGWNFLCNDVTLRRTQILNENS